MFEWAVLGGVDELTLIKNLFSLCNFRDLIYALTACNTQKRKENLKLHYMTPLKQDTDWLITSIIDLYCKTKGVLKPL